jgi:preprotein translocase subunit SecY
MKKFIESISNVWKIEELRNRILITLGLLLVYRFGAHVTLPGIDATQLNSSWANQKWYWLHFRHVYRWSVSKASVLL